MSGTLYLCATPIGNLGDVSDRCRQVLSSVGLIAAEDTRRTIQLLNHFGISCPLTSYHEHNKREKGVYIVSMLNSGMDVALVSDAGTPAISDPGEDLVRLCVEEHITVTSVPGAVAAVNALIVSGLPARRFAFEGFLSVNKRHRHEHLESVKYDTHTLIFYEAPHKLRMTLGDMRACFGGQRRIALARELTKIHEEIIRCTLDEAIAFYEEKTPRGEYVIVVEGASEEREEEHSWDGQSVSEQVESYIADGIDAKEAVRRTAKDRGIPKREVYREYHQLGADDASEEGEF